VYCWLPKGFCCCSVKIEGVHWRTGLLHVPLLAAKLRLEGKGVVITCGCKGLKLFETGCSGL
jgi:hypothetical protein